MTKRLNLARKEEHRVTMMRLDMIRVSGWLISVCTQTLFTPGLLSQLSSPHPAPASSVIQALDIRIPIGDLRLPVLITSAAPDQGRAARI